MPRLGVFIAGCLVAGILPTGCQGSRGTPRAGTDPALPREVLPAVNKKTVQGLLKRWKPWPAPPRAIEVASVTPIKPHMAVIARVTDPPKPGAQPAVGKDYPKDGVCAKHLPFNESLYLLVFKRQGEGWRLHGFSPTEMPVTIGQQGLAQGTLEWRDLNGDGKEDLLFEAKVENHIVKECGHASEQRVLKIFGLERDELKPLLLLSVSSQLEDCEDNKSEHYQLKKRPTGLFDVIVTRRKGGDSGDHCEDWEANLAITSHTIYSWDRAGRRWAKKQTYWDAYHLTARLDDKAPRLTAERLKQLRKKLAARVALKPGFPRTAGKTKTLLLGICPEEDAANAVDVNGAYTVDRARDPHTGGMEDVQVEVEVDVAQVKSRAQPSWSCPRTKTE